MGVVTAPEHPLFLSETHCTETHTHTHTHTHTNTPMIINITAFCFHAIFPDRYVALSHQHPTGTGGLARSCGARVFARGKCPQTEAKPLVQAGRQAGKGA